MLSCRKIGERGVVKLNEGLRNLHLLRSLVLNFSKYWEEEEGGSEEIF